MNRGMIMLTTKVNNLNMVLMLLTMPCGEICIAMTFFLNYYVYCNILEHQFYHDIYTTQLRGLLVLRIQCHICMHIYRQNLDYCTLS